MVFRQAARLGQRSGDLLQNCVVLADDNPELLYALEHLISYQDIEVHGAQDGLTALQLCRRLQPKVVVADLFMPHMSGLELIEALKEDPILRSSYVILLSGAVGDRNELVSLAPAANRHLLKPIDADDLVAAIETGMEAGTTRGGLLGRIAGR